MSQQDKRGKKTTIAFKDGISSSLSDPLGSRITAYGNPRNEESRSAPIPGVPNFIVSRNLDPNKIVVGPEKDIANGYLAYPILYDYESRQNMLMITTPRDEESYVPIQMAGILPSNYPSETQKNQCLFALSKEKKAHVDIIIAIDSIAKRCSEELGLPVTVKKIEDRDGYRLYVPFVESKKGVIHSKIYDDEGLVEIDELSGRLSRPGFSFSIIYNKTTKDAKLVASIYHLYVMETNVQFVLSTMEENS